LLPQALHLPDRREVYKQLKTKVPFAGDTASGSGRVGKRNGYNKAAMALGCLHKRGIAALLCVVLAI